MGIALMRKQIGKCEYEYRNEDTYHNKLRQIMQWNKYNHYMIIFVYMYRYLSL